MGRTHNITGSNAGQLPHGRWESPEWTTNPPLTTKDLQGIGQLSHFERVGPMGVTAPKLASPERYVYYSSMKKYI